MILEDLGLPAFAARPPWLGGHLQTVRNALMKPAVARPPASGTVLRFPTSDGTGDVLQGTLDSPPDAVGGQPLVLLAHGVAGSAESYYMRATAADLLGRGYRVLRMNLRGAGPSRPDCKRHYHAGRSQDLRDVISGLSPELTALGIVAVGFSLGGNTVLKLAGEQGPRGPVIAVASVCAPIDLGATTRAMNRRGNRFYQSYLLKAFKAEYVAPGAEMSDQIRAAVDEARSFVEFDATVTAPRNAYPNVGTFYAENSARHFLTGIQVPALAIAAADDPIIPFSTYRAVDWSRLPAILPAFTAGGGHVGHHGRGGIWYIGAIAQFLSALARRDGHN